jgi:3-oxoadipate enol-lactonase
VNVKATVNGIQMGYTDSGSGTPVLLVHGYPLNKSMWDAQVAELSKGFRVIAPDLRGHGESDAPQGTYSMDAIADDLNALLDHLKVDKAVVVGFSMGGYATFAFYRKYANKVKALVLADTRPQADTPEAKQGREDTAQTVIKDGVAGVATVTAPRMLAPTTVQGRADVVERVKSIMASTSVNGYVGDLRGLASRPDSTDTLSKIDVPTLVIVGEQDVVTPVADSETMAKTIKGAKLAKVPNAGHLAPLEQPADFNKALVEFLKGLPK